MFLSQIGGKAVWVLQAEDQGNKQDPKGDESHFLQSKRIFWSLPSSSPGVAPLGDPPMFEVPVLLGHLHAAAADRQPDYPPRRHLLLQRWPLHQQVRPKLSSRPLLLTAGSSSMWSLTPFFSSTSSSTSELVRLWQEKAIWWRSTKNCRCLKSGKL